ncbi:MAG: penicillin-binding protein 2 [Candidatus Saccharimonadales bacterium]
MPPRNNSLPSGSQSAVQRLHLWYGALLFVAAIFVVRAFYLQVIRHDYYHQLALSSQLKEYEIPAERGVIAAHDGDGVVPIVLNQKLYTLFADPQYIKDPAADAQKIATAIGGNSGDYEKEMKAATRYSILAKKLNKDQKSKIDKLQLKGVGTREASYRTYPQGQLAAQLLGFVNDEGEGKYGVEQALNSQLNGTPGELKAITDARGIPLVANKDNIVKKAVPGKRLVLTIDIAMQKQLEDTLKKGLDRARSQSGDALIIDPESGAILAMASYPTYNPAEFYKVENPAAFTSGSVSEPLEVGSSMKPLTAAAALDLGVVKRETTYYDPSQYTVDGYKITNIEEDGGAGTRSVSDIIQLSLNTGATWLLMQMGGGQINQKARENWHNYMIDHYQFGKQTGVEQGYESGGTIPDPNDGYALNLQYANTSFGQGMTATPLQMGAALASVVNGGKYYKPHLVDGYMGDDGNLTKQIPTIVKSDVVKPDTGRTLKEIMEYSFSKNYRGYGMANLPAGYSIGGKTGTAQIAKPGGGYYEDKFNGTFVGFVGGDMPQYVMVTRVNEPKIGGYAGSQAAAPIFSDLTTMLINNFNVVPKRN